MQKRYPMYVSPRALDQGKRCARQTLQKANSVRKWVERAENGPYAWKKHKGKHTAVSLSTILRISMDVDLSHCMVSILVLLLHTIMFICRGSEKTRLGGGGGGGGVCVWGGGGGGG